MVAPVLAQELLEEKNPVKPFAEKILTELKLSRSEKKEVRARRKVKIKKGLEEIGKSGAPLRKLHTKLLTSKKTKKLTARERRILSGLRKKKSSIEKFGRNLARQQKRRPKIIRYSQAPHVSIDNKHERRLRSLQKDSDDYERHLQRVQVPENYFLRKMMIAKRKRLLQREFARKNNLLAKQQEMPRESFKIIDEEDNILKPKLNIMQKTPNSISINEKRQFNILQTKQAGNSLFF